MQVLNRSDLEGKQNEKILVDFEGRNEQTTISDSEQPGGSTPVLREQQSSEMNEEHGAPFAESKGTNIQQCSEMEAKKQHEFKEKVARLEQNKCYPLKQKVKATQVYQIEGGMRGNTCATRVGKTIDIEGATTPTMEKVPTKKFHTDLPIDFDPIMFNPDNHREMNWPQLVGKVKLVARRSVSPVGRSSEKLTKLRKRVDFLDHDVGKALTVDLNAYLEDNKVQFQVKYQDPPSPSRDHRPRRGRGRGRGQDYGRGYGPGRGRTQDVR
ncbi:hypothetical protein LIER_16819 [Lithospermum erythrorhizon]|uniref:Uncharacterized protein n=1 Tax=Lithospermum erythrorhizon TaxID=34254 RepID=A0AAV3Q9Q0_LITER